MTLPSANRRPYRLRVALAVPGLLAAALGGSVLAAGPAGAAGASAVGVAPAQGEVVSLSAEYLAANKVDDTKVKGDDGRRSFGVQPAGAKKPDARPNLTYRGVKPGQRLFDRVAFVNISNRPVTLSVYPSDAFNTPEGAFDVLRKNQRSTDLGSWVKLRRDVISVPARSALITPIELNVPKNAEPGDHAAAIIASLRTTAKDAKGNTVNRDDRVGTRLYVRVAGKLGPKMELERRSASFDADTLLKGRATITYTVRNTGNVRLLAKQSLRVTGLLGMSSDGGEVPDLPELLPGNEITFTQPVKNVIPTFFNTAHIVIDPVSVTGNTDPALAQVSASSGFNAMSWPGLAVLLLALAFGARYLLRRRRSRPAAAGPGGWNDGGTPPGGVGPGGGAPPAQRTPAGMTHRVRLVVVALLGSLAALLPAAAPASAADGALTFLPGKGTSATPIYGVTSAGCPAKGTHIVGYMYGNGFPKAGAVVMANQDAPVRHDGAFGFGLRDNLKSIAAEVGATLKGRYRITIKCIDQLNLTTYAQFSGTVTFSTPDRFTAPVPPKPPVAGVPPGYLALVFPEYKKQVAAEFAGSQADNRADLAQQAQQKAGRKAQGPTAAAPLPQQASGGTHGPLKGLGWSPLLVLAVMAAAAGCLYLWVRRPVPTAGPSARTERVLWPDDHGR